MVPILVIATFIAFIVVSWLISHVRQAETEVASIHEAFRAPPDAALAVASQPISYLHPCHVWVRLAPDGIATVGASDFAANFVGALSRMETPEKGMVLRQGEPAWTLISGKNRRLTQAMPLDGEVLEVNQDLAGRGGSDRSAPRTSGWILKVRPARLAENLQNLFRGSLADAWQEMAGSRLNAVLVPALGRVANDGGVWIENFGDLLEDSDWRVLREDLFPPQPAEHVR
jgi:glycine cleavage system H protein